MNRAIRTQTNQGTLLVLILNFCCVDHDDVTWDNLKGESFREQKRKRRQRVFREKQELQVLLHIFYFDIAHILSVVLDFFQNNMELCYNFEECFQ